MANMKDYLVDVLSGKFVRESREFPAPPFIHGVFNPTADVFAAFKARCAAKGIDFGKFSWVGSEVAPEFDPEDPETVVVLDATLDTLQNTFEYAWAWIEDEYKYAARDDGVLSDAEHLRLLSNEDPWQREGDGPDFKPWLIRWVRIKLNANLGKRVGDVRDPKSSPGCALLFMAAEHPKRMKTQDLKKPPFLIPGLVCKAPDGWLQQLELSYFWFTCKVTLSLHSYDCQGPAVPVFRKKLPQPR